MDYFREISARLTKSFEKLRLAAYPDNAGVLTWGWGHTGRDVKAGGSITRAQADALFDRDQAAACARLRKHIPDDPWLALNENQKAALLDFAFNAGGGPVAGQPEHEWEIWDRVRAGKLADVPAELERFVYVHTAGKAVVSAGLTNRRAAEIKLWKEGV